MNELEEVVSSIIKYPVVLNIRMFGDKGGINEYRFDITDKSVSDRLVRRLSLDNKTLRREADRFNYVKPYERFEAIMEFELEQVEDYQGLDKDFMRQLLFEEMDRVNKAILNEQDLANASVKINWIKEQLGYLK